MLLYAFQAIGCKLEYDTGLQKDRYRGTTGPKEGLSTIGRFGWTGQI
jgi:hypothetical protein